ncbi:hypothetical protein [Nocardia neocaledoniensis]|uniref:hypothetical protein n=1 Tax=Nocardia neocaledoniensis TaxID=236511 RepID=UPI003D7B7ACA
MTILERVLPRGSVGRYQPQAAIAAVPAEARAVESYRRAAQLTASVPEQRYLNARAAHLDRGLPSG